MSDRLIKDLALVLDHEATDPQLCDLVAIAGQNHRDLKEAIRLLTAATTFRDPRKFGLDAQDFLDRINPRLQY